MGLPQPGVQGRLPGHAGPIRGVVLAPARSGGHLRTTRLFVRRARPGLYFNRVPSLPATDDGNARSLAEDLSIGSGGGEDITGNADTEPGTTDAGVTPEAAGADGEPRTPEAAGADGESPVGPVRTGGAPKAGAEPRVGESGRWFRPAKAEAGFLAIPPDEQADVAIPGAEPQATAADASTGRGGMTAGPAEPGTAKPGTAEARHSRARYSRTRHSRDQRNRDGRNRDGRNRDGRSRDGRNRDGRGR